VCVFMIDLEGLLRRDLGLKVCSFAKIRCPSLRKTPVFKKEELKEFCEKLDEVSNECFEKLMDFSTENDGFGEKLKEVFEILIKNDNNYQTSKINLYTHYVFMIISYTLLHSNHDFTHSSQLSSINHKCSDLSSMNRGQSEHKSIHTRKTRIMIRHDPQTHT